MPAPALSPLVLTLLRQAYVREQAVANSGAAWLATEQGNLVGLIDKVGLQMVSVQTSGKGFSYANGWKVDSLADALDEAIRLWASYDSAELAIVLNSRRIKTAQVKFAPAVIGTDQQFT